MWHLRCFPLFVLQKYALHSHWFWRHWVYTCIFDVIYSDVRSHNAMYTFQYSRYISFVLVFTGSTSFFFKLFCCSKVRYADFKKWISVEPWTAVQWWWKWSCIEPSCSRDQEMISEYSCLQQFKSSSIQVFKYPSLQAVQSSSSPVLKCSILQAVKSSSLTPSWQ